MWVTVMNQMTKHYQYQLYIVKNPNKMKITLTPQESEEFFYNSLCNAVGTGYMDSYGIKLVYSETMYEKAKNKLTNPCFEDVLMQILRDGNGLTFHDIEGDGEYTRTISLEDVHNKVQLTPVIHLQDMINENDDVTTADVILQTVFFDDIIFG